MKERNLKEYLLNRTIISASIGFIFTIFSLVIIYLNEMLSSGNNTQTYQNLWEFYKLIIPDDGSGGGVFFLGPIVTTLIATIIFSIFGLIGAYLIYKLKSKEID